MRITDSIEEDYSLKHKRSNLGEHDMKNRFQNILGLIVLLCCGILFAYNDSTAQELRKEGRYYVVDVTKNFKVSQGGTLRMVDINGDASINTWDKNEVQIHEIKKMDVLTEAEAKAALERFLTSFKQQGNRVEVDGSSYSREWMKSRFDIYVPKLFNVDVATRAGDLTVMGLTGTVSLTTSGGEIVLGDIDGEVDARTSGGNIEVSNSKQAVSLKTSGGNIKLENIGGPLDARTSGGDIKLRGSSDLVDIGTSGGDIRISDTGGRVKANTSGGDIDVADTRGSVEVQTSGGDIQFRNIGGKLQASTSGGDIEGTSIQGGAEVSTSGGSIYLKDVKGGVGATTSGGNITVEITLKDFSKDHHVHLTTAGGEIELTIPAKLPATIRAEIEMTDRWGDYNIYSDFPLTTSKGAEKEGGRRERGQILSSTGDINGGGDLIELHTTNGNIHIKKLTD